MRIEKQNRQAYPSDLTDAQWEVIKPLYSHLRVYKWSKRELNNALMYVVKNGCQWGQLPHDFLPFQTVWVICQVFCSAWFRHSVLLELLFVYRKIANISAFDKTVVQLAVSALTILPYVLINNRSAAALNIRHSTFDCFFNGNPGYLCGYEHAVTQEEFRRIQCFQTILLSSQRSLKVFSLFSPSCE